MLSPALDPKALAPALAARGRLQIPGFLIEEVAAGLHGSLRRDVPWGLAYREAGVSRSLAPAALRALDPAARAALVRRVHEEARDGYQFMYHAYPMVSAYKERRDPGLPLHAVLEYLNSDLFLGFARQLTGVEGIRRVDAQATCYLPGDFLKYHTDIDTAEGRRFAYVINLTRRWEADWGGLLQFMDGAGAVVDTFMPRWNALNLFAVPTPHCVSFVAPYAAEPRLAITGWFLDR